MPTCCPARLRMPSLAPQQLSLPTAPGSFCCGGAGVQNPEPCLWTARPRPATHLLLLLLRHFEPLVAVRAVRALDAPRRVVQPPVLKVGPAGRSKLGLVGSQPGVSQWRRQRRWRLPVRAAARLKMSGCNNPLALGDPDSIFCGVPPTTPALDGCSLERLTVPCELQVLSALQSTLAPLPFPHPSSPSPPGQRHARALIGFKLRVLRGHPLLLARQRVLQPRRAICERQYIGYRRTASFCVPY